MADYGNGKVYSIRSHLSDDVYYGSTTQPLSKRMVCHRANYNSYINGKRGFVSSFDIMKHGDAYIELVELYPCAHRCELTRREGEIIRQNECVNRNIAGRTHVEYRSDNKEKILTSGVIYRSEHKEQTKIRSDKYYVENKDKIKARRVIYQSEHKEKLKNYADNYYLDNKDRIKNRIREKALCECGSFMILKNIPNHCKTKKHLYWQSIYDFIFI